MTMATKKAAPTDDELLAQLDDLSKPKPGKSNAARGSKQAPSQTEQDLLAELGNLAQRPTSRPETPSLKPNAAAGSRIDKSPKRSTATPPPGRTSEEKPNEQRKSGDSQRSLHQTFTPATTTTEESPELEPETTTTAPAKSGGSWWGGFLSTATAAVTQAQAAVKEIQNNDEAQRWTDQLTANVGVLRGFGDLRSMAMPTFQNILQTLAPPISAHERLAIHIAHDLKNYPSLDPTIYQVFSRVMSQVEGGDLIVVQRGAESGPKRSSKEGSRQAPSWQDGPWWRSGEKRELNAVRGLVEGTKLVRASAEGYATEYFSNKGGVEQAAKRATETLNESNPTRESEIFLAIQPISQDVSTELFRSGATDESEGQVKETEEKREEIIFAVYLHDPIHGIAFQGLSQAMPRQWLDWLDASTEPGVESSLPDSIREIIDNGGVDPREWVSEWVEETLSLAIGMIAQRYVARRMGVGEGGMGRGKGKLKADMSTETMVQSGGGEMARAMGGM